jgi:hypothetical protein
MNEDQAITQAAARAAVAYRNGDDTDGDYWTARVTILSDQREAVRLRQSFDVLKGHPDHSGASRLEESIARLERRG